MILSARQYPMLRALVDNGPDHYMRIEEARRFDQRCFRSMLIRRYCTYKSGRGFHVTSRGRQAMYEFENTNIIRKDPHAPLTAYFDMERYNLSYKARGAA